MNEQQTRTRLVVLAVLAFALFNYPLLRVFDQDVIVLGVPLVWLYVFVSWAVLIVLVALTVRDR
ncbi:MAG TPA: hypothetical protein VFR87_17760 [Nocardioidaceae bacterium]|nr:hypothetical protein [Nocardioidaceae bacterium]